MQNAKPVSTPLAAHFKLLATLSPKTDDERDYMPRVPYSSAAESLMYAIVCSRPDLSYAASAVSRYMANCSKEHWKTVQRIFRFLHGSADVCLQFGRNRDVVIEMGDTDRRTVRVAAPRMGNLELPPEDGYTWRKYGQKEILGSRFPRCTHQKLYHCPAKKQVQRLDNDPYVFEVTYRSQHICYMSATAPTVPPPSVEEITHQTTTTPPPLLPLPPPTSASLSGQWLSMDIKPQVEAGTSYTTAQFDIQRDFGHASGGSLTSICNVVTACVGGGAGPSGSRFGREVDYQPVVDMADAMFNSGSSSNTSMDIIFSSIDDKWDTTQKNE
ncbi:WRKY transcription factor 55 [Capsicum baccatum]|uniref:WRKY transcription factor 55 n=1 Tax=Capsicum baccatum TaxID=33114 RepID=A0A2G2WI77_CAPBA|nr:WRKY transcription factor 55 [Capsicum baccatum]